MGAADSRDSHGLRAERAWYSVKRAALFSSEHEEEDETKQRGEQQIEQRPPHRTSGETCYIEPGSKRQRDCSQPSVASYALGNDEDGHDTLFQHASTEIIQPQ